MNAIMRWLAARGFPAPLEEFDHDKTTCPITHELIKEPAYCFKDRRWYEADGLDKWLMSCFENYYAKPTGTTSGCRKPARL